MHSDSSRHALALEYLFLFHACKLTNHRPDQSVSQADVARAAGLSEDQSEEICTPLREARLIRFCSLLGDISATRFGVSEIITSKACPNSGSNYFPAISQMGLRYSRGHHLFDESELTWASRYQDFETGDRATELEEPDRTAPTELADAAISTKDTRQALIAELEKLLNELSDEPLASSVHTTQTPDKQSPKPAGEINSEAIDQSSESSGRNGESNGYAGTPSLLLNANWSANRQQKLNCGQGQEISALQTHDEIEPAQGLATQPPEGLPVKPNAGTDAAEATRSANNLTQEDALGQLEVLFRCLQSAWSKPAGEKLIRRRARGLIDELETVNASLLHFA